MLHALCLYLFIKIGLVQSKNSILMTSYSFENLSIVFYGSANPLVSSNVNFFERFEWVFIFGTLWVHSGPLCDGHAMWVACNRARFPATQPRVFCELKIMKIVILIYQIIQEKFANGELFMLVMTEYIFMFKMVKKMQNSGLEIVAGLTPPLRLVSTQA